MPKGDVLGLECPCTPIVLRSWFTLPEVCLAGIVKHTVKSSNSVHSDEISRLICHYAANTQFSLLIRNTSEIATLQRHIQGIGALKFICADWVYTYESPMPPWDSVCKDQFSISSKYVDLRSHLARPCNSFDIASAEGNVVHLKTVSSFDVDATGGESPFSALSAES